MTIPYASIGYTRDDGDFRILATLNNVDEEITNAHFAAIVNAVAARLQEALRDDFGEIPSLEILDRQDTPDYVTLDEEEAAPPERTQTMTSDLLITERVQRCRKALAAYPDDDRFTCLIDLLADAMHWCAAHGETFGYALAVAGKHYIAELNGEQTDERRMP